MIPIFHFIASLILFIALYPYFGLSSLIVFLTGWLIDFDHVLYYVFKFRDFSYKRMYKYYYEHKFKEKVINAFHTIEFYILIAVLGFYSIYALIAAVGLFAHVVMDFMHFISIKKYNLRYLTITGWILDLAKGKRK